MRVYKATKFTSTGLPAEPGRVSDGTLRSDGVAGRNDQLVFVDTFEGTGFAEDA